jgi:hypothetical protein
MTVCLQQGKEQPYPIQTVVIVGLQHTKLHPIPKQALLQQGNVHPYPMQAPTFLQQANVHPKPIQTRPKGLQHANVHPKPIHAPINIAY